MSKHEFDTKLHAWILPEPQSTDTTNTQMIKQQQAQVVPDGAPKRKKRKTNPIQVNKSKKKDSANWFQQIQQSTMKNENSRLEKQIEEQNKEIDALTKQLAA